MAAVKRSAIKRRKDFKNIEKGQVHVHASFNNTIVTITDMKGDTICWSSSGKLGMKGSKKALPYAASMVAEDAAKIAKNHGLRIVEVYIKGPGQGREAAIRALEKCDLQVTMIRDVSPIPHNGCRPPKVRRL